MSQPTYEAVLAEVDEQVKGIGEEEALCGTKREDNFQCLAMVFGLVASTNPYAVPLLAAAALIALHDERTSRNKTMSNFAEYAEPRGDAILQASLEGLEKLVEKHQQQIADLACDLLAARAEQARLTKELEKRQRALEFIHDDGLRLEAEASAADDRAQRYRHAWMSARERARDLWDSAERLGDERDMLRDALKDSAGGAWRLLCEAERYRLAWESARVRACSRLERIGRMHGQLADAHAAAARALIERDESRAAVREAGASS